MDQSYQNSIVDCWGKRRRLNIRLPAPVVPVVGPNSTCKSRNTIFARAGLKNSVQVRGTCARCGRPFNWSTTHQASWLSSYFKTGGRLPSRTGRVLRHAGGLAAACSSTGRAPLNRSTYSERQPLAGTFVAAGPLSLTSQRAYDGEVGPEFPQGVYVLLRVRRSVQRIAVAAYFTSASRVS